MADVTFVAILTAFFALAVLFVKACERIIGPDLEAARLGADSANVTVGGDEKQAAA